ncbi:MAG: hypothetical protein IBJ11_11310 [Phycisphaerales bacterium]|nr:hypothetical protein [Phycisphaerales bacterium]
MNSNRRVIALLAIIAAIGGAWVVSGRFRAGDGAEPASESPRERYLERLRVVEGKRALVADESAWLDAARAARAEFDASVRGMAVRAKTTELAESQLRDRVLAVMNELKLTSPRVEALRLPDVLPAAQPSPGQPPTAGPADALRVVAVRVQFDAPDPRAALALIDRLENFPDLRTNIPQVSIEGPGRLQTSSQVVGQLTVHALALIGEEN